MSLSCYLGITESEKLGKMCPSPLTLSWGSLPDLCNYNPIQDGQRVANVNAMALIKEGGKI